MFRLNQVLSAGVVFAPKVSLIPDTNYQLRIVPAEAWTKVARLLPAFPSLTVSVPHP
jgi:hypothetical protein